MHWLLRSLIIWEYCIDIPQLINGQRIWTGRFQSKKLKLFIVIWKNALNLFWLEGCKSRQLRYHITPVRLANMTKQEDDKCWRRCGRVGTLIHCWWSCELIQTFWRAVWNYAQRATKMCLLPFDSAISLLGLYPKEITEMGKGPTCTKIFVAALFVVSKNWKSRGCLSIGEWLNKSWYMNVMEYYCAIRNDEQEDFREAWKDSYELMLSERSKTRRTLYTTTTAVCEEFFW